MYACSDFVAKKKKKKTRSLSQYPVHLFQHWVMAFMLALLLQEYRKYEEPNVHKLKEPILDEVSYALITRYGLNFTRKDVASLWFLCKEVCC